MTAAILPCSCGSFDTRFDEIGTEVYVQCGGCKIMGPKMPSVKEAITAWNLRGESERFTQSIVNLPLGLTVDDVDFILERYDVAFELSTCGGFYQDNAAGERERTYLTIIRKMIEKGVM